MDVASSSALSLNYFDVKCEICRKSSHGLHFGVETCRACAAFFRRTVVLNRKYKCKKRNGKCTEDFEGEKKDERLMCRFCRFKKCIDLGMTTENVRVDQILPCDISSTVETPEIAAKKTENRVEYQVIDPRSQQPAILIDVAAIIKKSRMILEMYYLPDDDEMESMNALQKVTFALEKIRKNQKGVDEMEYKSKLKFHEVFQLWEAQMLHAAEWLMSSTEFRNLPIHEKLAFFKLVWAVWRRFERNTMTVDLFGQRCFDEKIILQSHEIYSMLGKYSIDYSSVFNRKHTDLFQESMLEHMEVVVPPFLEYKFSTTETAYMLSQVVWSYAGRRLQGQTLAASERFSEELGNNLHEYYVNNGSSNAQYSRRIMKMMGIVNGILNIQLKRENTMDLAMVFDLFNIVITEPEFFKV